MEDAELYVELSRIRERARQTYWRNWLLRCVPLCGAAIIAALAFVVGRPGWRALPDPPLSAGLPRPQRVIVGRDLRRGSANADPVLRAVEDAVAEKYRRSGPATAWVCAIFAVAFVLYALFGADVSVRIMSVVGATIMTAAGVQQMRLDRGLRAFGSSNARA